MPFPIEEKYIIETESELNVKFPTEFKNRMKMLNGGEIEEVIEDEEEDYIYCLTVATNHTPNRCASYLKKPKCQN